MICLTSFQKDISVQSILLVFANGINNPFKCEPEKCTLFQKRSRSTFIP